MATLFLLILCLFGRGLCYSTLGAIRYMVQCYTPPPDTFEEEMASKFCIIPGGESLEINSTNVLKFVNHADNFNIMHEFWMRGTVTYPRSPTSSSTALGAHNPEDSTMHDLVDSTQGYDDQLYDFKEYPSDKPYFTVKIWKVYYEYCSTNKFFLCKTYLPVLEKICPPGFEFYGANCYKAISFPQANYEDAQKFCAQNDARLATLNESEKLWEAKSALFDKNETFLVSARKHDDVLMWNNQSKFYLWYDEVANFSQGDCLGYLSLPERPFVFLWVPLECEEKHNFLCEADTLDVERKPQKLTATSTDHNTEKTSTTAVTTTTTSPLSCPVGGNWKSHDASGYCFWDTTNETERLNWFEARAFCRLNRGDLASYDYNELENIGLGGGDTDLWIGLQRHENSDLSWVDGNTYSMNWDSGEPNLKSNTKFCGTLSAHSSKLALDYCGVRKWFICKVPKTENPLRFVIPVPQKRTICRDKRRPYRDQWYDFNSECYLIQPGNFSWASARLHCQNNGGDMASIHSFEQTNSILKFISNYTNSEFWIGLSAHRLRDSYEWADKTPLNFTYWAENKSGENHPCVTFNKRDGSWDTDNCKHPRGVICKGCEIGWYTLGNKCLKLFRSRKTWVEASKECDSLGATLLSVHNQADQDFLAGVLTDVLEDVWLGLRALYTEAIGTVVVWSDGSVVDYTNWGTENKSPSGFGECAALTWYERNWYSARCKFKKSYVCQKIHGSAKKSPKSVRPSNPTLTEDLPSNKLSGGEIFGIMVCIIGLPIIIGALVYCLKPGTRQVKTELVLAWNRINNENSKNIE